jgi:hypothetical protein
MQMDIDLSTLQDWISQADTYRDFTIQSIEVSEKTVLKNSVSSDRQFILVPRSDDGWTSVHEYLMSEINKSASTSTTPAATPSP